MKLYWKVKRDGEWVWVPAIITDGGDDWVEVSMHPRCECKTCVPGQTDGDE